MSAYPTEAITYLNEEDRARLRRALWVGRESSCPSFLSSRAIAHRPFRLITGACLKRSSSKYRINPLAVVPCSRKPSNRALIGSGT